MGNQYFDNFEKWKKKRPKEIGLVTPIHGPTSHVYDNGVRCYYQWIYNRNPGCESFRCYASRYLCAYTMIYGKIKRLQSFNPCCAEYVNNTYVFTSCIISLNTGGAITCMHHIILVLLRLNKTARI